MASILIIDDESTICYALSRHLKGRGHRVRTAEDGALALAQIADEPLPDVFLIDMCMPGLDGRSFKRALDERFPGHGPVIVMTGAVDAEARARAIGAAGWLEKPFSLEDVSATIQRVLATPAPAPAPAP